MHTFLKRLIVSLLVSLIQAGAYAATVQESLQFVSASGEYIEQKSVNGLTIDLKYASANNFVGQNMYGAFNKAYLHRIAAAKLAKAIKNLEGISPKFKLIVYDALRPRSVQFILWDKVKGSEQEKYVANPKGGSIHNYGFALDISIVDESGKELDMGTPYDDFTELAQPRFEEKFLQLGKLNAQQIINRRLLRKVMEDAGFIQLPLEWWHFDALPKAEVRTKFRIVE